MPEKGGILIKSVLNILFFVFWIVIVKLLIIEWREKLHDLKALNVPIVTDHGETEAEIVRGLSTERYEHSVLFDKEGRKLLELTSQAYRFVHYHCPQFEEVEDQIYLRLHNHPRTDTAFSDSDLGSLSCARYIKVITPAHVYTLENPRFDDGFRPDYRKLIFYYDMIQITPIGLLLTLYDGLVMTYHSRGQCKLQIYCCNKVAKKFGLNFTIEPLSAY